VTSFGRVLNYVLSGYETSGVLHVLSGDPLTVYGINSNNDGSGQGRDRAVQTGPAYGGSACATVTTPCRSWLNPLSFSSPPAGGPLTVAAYGNVRKGAFIGPRFVQLDASLARTFPLGHHTGLQLRADYFNFFNHTNLGDPGLTAGSSSFGRVTGVIPQNASSANPNTERVAQLSAKLTF